MKSITFAAAAFCCLLAAPLASANAAEEYTSDFFISQAAKLAGPAAKSVAKRSSSSAQVRGRKASASRHASSGGGSTMASWYGGGEKLAKHTASGEVFRANGLTAAHRTLPLGTRLLVSSNGHSVIVRVNDRGPAAWTGRSLDLSKGAARALGMIGRGTARVSWRTA